MQKTLIACLLAFPAFMSPAMAQVDPVCVYPQWLWANTGPIYHYYSEFGFDDGAEPPMMACQWSYWGNWDSGNGNENTNVGCANMQPPCANGGFNALLPAAELQHTLWGPQGFAETGYKGELQNSGVEPVIKKDGKEFSAKTNSPSFIVKIKYDDEDLRYYKLFDYEVTAKRKKIVPGMPPELGEPRSIISRFGLQVSESDKAIEVSKDKVRRIKDRVGKELNGVFLLDLGPRTFVVRNHAKE